MVINQKNVSNKKRRYYFISFIILQCFKKKVLFFNKMTKTENCFK